MNIKDDEDQQQNEDYNGVDSIKENYEEYSTSLRDQKSSSDSPNQSKTMLSLVEEDLNNIIKSQQYQKQLDPQLLKKLAKSIVAIKYTSKVTEKQDSTSQISENQEYQFIDSPPCNSDNHAKLRRESQGNEQNLKLTEAEQDELNSIEFRKKKSSSVSEKAARISFQPKVNHHVHNQGCNKKCQLTPLDTKKSSHETLPSQSQIHSTLTPNPDRSLLAHIQQDRLSLQNNIQSIKSPTSPLSDQNNNNNNTPQNSHLKVTEINNQIIIQNDNNFESNLNNQVNQQQVLQQSQQQQNHPQQQQHFQFDKQQLKQEEQQNDIQLQKQQQEQQQQLQQQLIQEQEQLIQKQDEQDIKSLESKNEQEIEQIKEFESESSSDHISPKCSEDADMYQPFTHFFVLGSDQSDLTEFQNQKVERVLVPGKLLYSYSDRIVDPKNDPFDLVKKQVSEYAFPFGVECKKLDVSDGDTLQIQQIIIPPTKHGMFDRFFFFKMRSQENFKQVQVEKQKNDLLKLINPNKVLFFTCLQIKDCIVTEDENKKKCYWRNQKVFCFVSYFPFYDLFTILLSSMQDQIKVERQFKLMQENNLDVLSQIDSDFVQKYIASHLEGFLSQWQRQELRTLGLEYKFQLDLQTTFQYQLPIHQFFRQKSLLWTSIGPISVLSFSHFLFILFAILSEQHIIFVSSNLCLLTKAIACFESLIMPFQWPYPIVYTLPENLLGLLDSPQPIILGINRTGRYIISNEFVQNSPDHIFVLLDEGTILTDNDAYVKQYQSNPPSLSLKQSLFETYSKVGQSINKQLQIYNSKQYAAIFQTEQYRKTFPSPKFHTKQHETQALEDIIQICHQTLQNKIISNLPNQPIYDSEGQFIDYEQIKSKILEQTNSEDIEFISNFCSTKSQIFLYFCEDYYNLVEDNSNGDSIDKDN